MVKKKEMRETREREREREREKERREKREGESHWIPVLLVFVNYFVELCEESIKDNFVIT